jgi:CPA1 family monovalent cation:H+ antiporter
LLDSESLLNDGVAIVFFTLSLALVTGTVVTASGLAFDFIKIVGIGALIGAGVGLAVSQVIRQVDDPMIEITLTTIAAYGSFLAAEHFHHSRRNLWAQNNTAGPDNVGTTFEERKP